MLGNSTHVSPDTLHYQTESSIKNESFALYVGELCSYISPVFSGNEEF